jgi:NTE family protein
VKPRAWAWILAVALGSGALAYGLWYQYRHASLPADYAAADAPVAAAPVPPGARRVALVLGAGGNRGHAHVGVLKVLEEAGLEPDLLVGVSAGAVVGALRAAGLAAREIERRALALDARSLAGFTLSRHGYLSGAGLARYVNEAVGARALESLGLAFAAVATRLPTGEPVAFTRGNTGIAVQASAAIPGIFVPVRIRGAVYADGDLSSPVPVQAARRLGAVRVIAVDVSADLADTPSLDDIPFEWIERDVMRRAIIDFEIRAADLVLRPKLPYFAGSDRAYKEMAIGAGEQAARAALPRLRELFAR